MPPILIDGESTVRPAVQDWQLQYRVFMMKADTETSAALTFLGALFEVYSLLLGGFSLAWTQLLYSTLFPMLLHSRIRHSVRALLAANAVASWSW